MKIKSKVVSDQFDGEVVVVNLESGAYYSLRDTAQEIWSLFENKISRPDVIKSFSNLTEDEKLKIENYVDFLLSEGLIEENETKVGDNFSSSLTYVGLTISKFDDMADLIMLDPIHEADKDKGWPHKAD
jgi:hypothetical protein